MHNHYHSHCHHNLKYCEHCDVVYCTLCSREWGQYKITYTYPPYRWVYQGIPYTITWGSTGTTNAYTVTTQSGNVVKDASVVNAFQNSTEYKNVVGNRTACTHI